jgi:DNA-binding transcriptional regulator YhcF (GntR family)
MDKLSSENKFAIMPEWVIELDISHTAFRLYAVLARYADNVTHQAFPSLDTLAERLSCSEKTVRRAIDDLVEHGAITKHNRGRYNSNLYTVMISPPEGTNMSSEGTKMSEEGTKMSQRVDKNVQVTITTQLEPEELEPLNDINEQFNQFWAIYPRKKGKGQARKAFEKALEKTDIATILDGVAAYITYGDMDDPQFIAHPSTWLNGERWEDEYAEVREVLRSPYVGGPREWVRDMHDMGEHFECKPGEFGCK